MAHGLLARLRYVADAGLALLFPPVCVGCGRLGEPFCASCAQRVEATPHPQCARCGFPQAVPTVRCSHCAHYGADSLRLTRAAALHTTPLREAIHAFKYDSQPELAPLLARYLVAVYAEPPWSTLPQPISAVVPVPLHRERLEERGYNQSALLAMSFCRAVALPMQPSWITRTRETRHQVGLGPSERHVNVQGAFAATAEVAGERLLLVDDVYTTGATLHACAVAAMAAGAHVVYGLTLAQPARRAQPLVLEPPDLPQDVPQDLPWWENEL